MVQKSARGSGQKSGAQGQEDHVWSTIPMAHSPQGFAALPFPWDESKDKVAVGSKGDKKAAKAKPTTGLAAKTAPLTNLTDLADRFGSDKGVAKHRYTELYHMLFHPYRDQPITFLELGLLNGGPEDGIPADRKTDDLPSIRMWLEFFPKAMIHGLDVSDFAWFKHDRFAFHRCDMDRRENIKATRAAMPEFDIILDDASHASHHQQNAFLELFPRLKSGGLYIIENLRGQPEIYERAGITKTAGLFRSFAENREFSHADPQTQAAFNALGGDISGCFLSQVGYAKNRRDQVAVIHKR